MAAKVHEELRQSSTLLRTELLHLLIQRFDGRCHSHTSTVVNETNNVPRFCRPTSSHTRPPRWRPRAGDAERAVITRQQRTFSVISAFAIGVSFVHMAAALALFSGPAWYEVGAALAMTLLVAVATWAIVGYQAYARRRRLRRSRWVGALFGVALVISMTRNGAYLYAHRPASDRLPEWLSLGIAFALAAFVPLLIGVASLARGALEDDRLTLDRAQDVAAKERAELGRLRLPRQNAPNRMLDAYTVRNAFALVRAAFNAAGVSPNPCKGVELPDTEDDEIRPMEKPQIAALLELLDTWEAVKAIGKIRPHRNAALYHVCVKCGLRLSEAIGLRRQDLDLDRRESRVRGQVQQGKRKKGKTPRAHRTVRFGHDRVEIFRQHCENQASEPEVAPQGWNSAGLVVCSETGAPPDQKNVWRQFMTLQERLDLMKPCPESAWARSAAAATARGSCRSITRMTCATPTGRWRSRPGWTSSRPAGAWATSAPRPPPNICGHPDAGAADGAHAIERPLQQVWAMPQTASYQRHSIPGRNRRTPSATDGALLWWAGWGSNPRPSV